MRRACLILLVFAVVALGVFGCSTNQTGKYIPCGEGMVLNTQNGELWVMQPSSGDGRSIKIEWEKISLPISTQIISK
jgi:hypothetical protein